MIPPFFILACDRSGSTLLRLMLNAHPRLCVPNESDFITELYDRLAEFGSLEHIDKIDSFADALFQIPRYRLWKLDDDEVRRQLHQAPPSFAGLIDAVFRCFCEKSAKPRWGDKTPRYTVRVDTLAKIFPSARLILLVRDPRAVHASLKEVDWHPHWPEHNARKWLSYWQKASRDLQTHYPTSHLIVKYEDLLQNPAVTLKIICEFLGEKYDPVMLEFHRTAGENQPEGVQDHALTLQPVDPSPADRWQRDLSPYEKFIIDRITTPAMLPLGYRPVPRPAALTRAGFSARAKIAPSLPGFVRRLIHS